MNLRIGGELDKRIESLLPEELTEMFGGEEKKYIPFFEQILYSIPAEEFLKEIIANVVSDSKSDHEKVRTRFEQIYKDAIKLYNKAQSEDDEEEDDILKSLGL
jgi:siroheme synthase (precorrin-2 oxidase/ferrochelatase)